MGSGKSTHGKKLAQLLEMPFYDLDEYIEHQENKSISDLFESEGEAAFREKETKYLKQLLFDESGIVIALGGGTVCFNNMLEFANLNGILIYISLPASALVQRLSSKKNSRPLLKNLNESQLQEFVTTLLNSREVYYKQAHLKINGINLRPEHLINEIKSLL